MFNSILTQILTLCARYGSPKLVSMELLFQSYYYTRLDGKDLLSKSTIYQITSGQRHIQHSWIKWYRDEISPNHNNDPLCPQRLHADMVNAIAILFPDYARKHVLDQTLLDMADILPSADRDRIIHAHHIACSAADTDPTADLMTRLMWYAMCWDYARWPSPGMSKLA